MEIKGNLHFCFPHASEIGLESGAFSIKTLIGCFIQLFTRIPMVLELFFYEFALCRYLRNNSINKQLRSKIYLENGVFSVKTLIGCFIQFFTRIPMVLESFFYEFALWRYLRNNSINNRSL